MKCKYHYRKIYRIVAALIMGVTVFIHGVTVYASNIVITGDSAGVISVTPTNNTLFDLTGLYPGDTSASSVTIRNNDMVNQGFEVFMYARNTERTEYDLGRVTKLTITDGNTTIYDDMLIDFDESVNSAIPIALGRIAGGTSKYLNFAIEIDGEKADNNYQNQQSNFVVTFVVSSYGPPVTPPPPPSDDDDFDDDDDDDDDDFVPAPVNYVEIADEVPPAFIPEEYIEPEIDDIPLGFAEPEADESIILDGEEVPLSIVKEMPKTGELNLVLYIIPGAVIICFGLYIILKKDKI